MALLARFFGRTVGEGAGVAIGTATAKGVEPALEQFGNTMREHFHHSALRAQDAALARARQEIAPGEGIDLGPLDPSKEAAYGGLRPERFNVLTELARDHPSVGELIRLRRRRLALGPGHGIEQGEFRDWLRRAGFTKQVIDSLTRLLVEYLAPADVANAVQQGFMPNDDILPVPDLQGGPYTVPSEESALDPSGEAAVAGLDKERLRILAQLSGNPPPPMELLELWRRGFITEGDVERGVREGRTKTKWLPAIKKLFWQLLPPSVLVNLRLRGYIEDDNFHARMRLHGFTADQANDWFLSAGRPLAPQQMLDLIARKGPSPTGGVFDWGDFDKGMVESDIKPKYASPAHALYFKYPPLFQLRRAVESGGMSPERAREVMHIERYEPQDIESLIASWTTSDGAELNGHVTKAANQMWTTLHRSFVAFEITEPQARQELGYIGVEGNARDQILIYWQRERELARKQLTPAQVKKAYAKPITNRATGRPWTRDDALDALVQRGYSLAEANEFLDL